jgi:hypothetical protein
MSVAITLDHFAGTPHHCFRFQCSSCTFMMDVLMHSTETTIAHVRVVYATSPDYDPTIVARMADIGAHPVHAPIQQACLAAANWHGQGTRTNVAPLPEEWFAGLPAQISEIPETLDRGSADPEQSGPPPHSAPVQEIAGREPEEIIDCAECDDFDDHEEEVADSEARPVVNVCVESPDIGDDGTLLAGADQTDSDLVRTCWDTPDEIKANISAFHGRHFSTQPGWLTTEVQEARCFCPSEGLGLVSFPVFVAEV